MAKRLDRGLLLAKLERIERKSPQESLDHEFEQMGIAGQLLSVAEVDESHQFRLVRMIESRRAPASGGTDEKEG